MLGSGTLVPTGRRNPVRLCCARRRSLAPHRRRYRNAASAGRGRDRLPGDRPRCSTPMSIRITPVISFPFCSRSDRLPASSDRRPFGCMVHVASVHSSRGCARHTGAGSNRTPMRSTFRISVGRDGDRSTIERQVDSVRMKHSVACVGYRVRTPRRALWHIPAIPMRPMRSSNSRGGWTSSFLTVRHRMTPRWRGI